MRQFPIGTVTFLFTDIEGSTRLWEQRPRTMQTWLENHDRILRRAIEEHGGVIVKSTGDGVFAAFAACSGALAAVVKVRRQLDELSAEEAGKIRVRFALHSGEAELREGDYFGRAPNRCARLVAAAHGGQIVCSSATARLAREHLPEGAMLADLGMHRLRDLGEPERVFELRTRDQASTFPPLRSLDAFRQNLPLPRTMFVGRTREVLELRALLRSRRLITLIGIGGVGKSRLGLQVAAEVVDDYHDGVFLVELAPLREASSVAQAIGATLGIELDHRTASGALSATTALIDFLRRRIVLLVLDNCEHLLAACAAIVHDLLAQCPSLTVLATSREHLAVEGERIWRVPPLEVPALKAAPGELLVADSVQLFGERAKAVAPQFIVDESNVAVVAEICRRLDGIPLAVELAAARIRHLAPPQIFARLTDRFRLLTHGTRTALPRQQTLRAAMDWSYELLDPAEQRLFARLGVFVGLASLDAIESVCAGDDRIDRDAAFGHLASLVDKSLVEIAESGEASRYRLLETVRDYALFKLHTSGELESMLDRHRDWFVTLAQQVPLRDFGSLNFRASAALGRESENLRAALKRCMEQNELSSAHALAARLWGVWMALRRFEDAREWLAALVDSERPARSAEELAVQLGMTHVFVQMGEFDSATARCNLVIRDAEQLRIDGIIASALILRALMAQTQRDPAARDYLVRAAELSLAVAEPSAAAEAMWLTAEMQIVESENGEAERMLARALEILPRRSVDESRRGHCHVALALLLHLRGDHAGALASAEHALALAPTQRERPFHTSFDLRWRGLGAAALAYAGLGRKPEADRFLRELLDEIEELRLPWGESDSLVMVAGVTLLLGDTERAACLLGAARGLMRVRGVWRRSSTGALYSTYIDRIRDVLPREAVQRFRDTGRAMSRDEALSYARR
jgi:predicted ATPase/class 3 adenylate cyclase